MNSSLLKGLISLVDMFEQECPVADEQTVDHFLGWANKREEGITPMEVLIQKKYVFSPEVIPTFNMEFLTRAYRYLWFYSKKAFDTIPLLTFHDFISLVTLAQDGSMTKTELIESTLNEKTSGMLVIKRLLDNGLISQMHGDTDKRSVSIQLTETGWETLRQVMPRMTQVTKFFNSAITEQEREQLARILLKIDSFHNPIYLGHRDASLDELNQSI